MTSDRKSKLFPNRQVERDSDCLTNKGSQGSSDFIGIADRNAGLHLHLDSQQNKGLEGNPGGRMKVLFVPEELEQASLLRGDFRVGKYFTNKLFQKHVKNNSERSSSMLFYAKSLINVKDLTQSEKQILVNKYKYYESVFPELNQVASGPSSKASEGASGPGSDGIKGGGKKKSDPKPIIIDRDGLLKKLDAEFTEGEAIQTVVNSKRRNTKLVKLIKDLALVEDGILRCACCKFEMQTAFGFEYIEAAHRIPLSKRPGGYILEDPKNDLFLLCPNCHVAYDGLDQVTSIVELKAAMKVRFKWVREEE